MHEQTMHTHADTSLHVHVLTPNIHVYYLSSPPPSPSPWARAQVHGRIKFNHRGQVAMANTAGRPNSNGSQFFITLGEASWLHKKHTIFGKVTGNTVFNLMRVNDVEVRRVRVCVTSASTSSSSSTILTHSLASPLRHAPRHPCR